VLPQGPLGHWPTDLYTRGTAAKLGDEFLKVDLIYSRSRQNGLKWV